MRRVVHAFILYNELDLLEYKLVEVGDVFDYIIIVEGNKTFSGMDKPFLFEQHATRYEKWLHKIVYVKVDDFPDTTDAWVRERHQRNCILRGISFLAMQLYDDDVLVIGDLDEIPDPGYTHLVKIGTISYAYPVRLRQHFYYYNFNCKSKTDLSALSYFSFKDLKRELETKDLETTLRQNLPTTDLVFGWHLSFFGGVEQIMRKLRAYSHHDEFPIDSYSETYIQECIEAQKSIFESQGDFTYVALKDNPYLPPHYEMLLSTET